MSAPQLEPGHEEALRQERFIAEVLKIRQPPAESKGRMEAWLGSSVVAAVVTVVGTAIIGNMVTDLYQDRSKRNDAILQLLRDKRAARETTVNKALQVTGGYVTAIEDLIHSTSPQFRNSDRTGAELKALETWKASIQAAHDKADAEWRRERDTFGFMLAFHDTENIGLHDRWQQLATQVDALEDCGNAWYMKHAWGADAPVKDACRVQRTAVNRGMLELLSALRLSEQKFFEAQMQRR